MHHSNNDKHDFLSMWKKMIDLGSENIDIRSINTPLNKIRKRLS